VPLTSIAIIEIRIVKIRDSERSQNQTRAKTASTGCIIAFAPVSAETSHSSSSKRFDYYNLVDLPWSSDIAAVFTTYKPNCRTKPVVFLRGHSPPIKRTTNCYAPSTKRWKPTMLRCALNSK